MKEGKKPLTDEEMKAKLQSLRDKEHDEAKRKLEDAQKRKDESVRKLVENAFQTQESANQQIASDERKLKGELTKHYIVLAVFFVLWFAFITYQNYDFAAVQTEI